MFAWIREVALIAPLMLVTGCEWLQKQDVQVCVEYKGRHVCVGRHDGVWTFETFSGDPLSDDDKNDLVNLISAR